MDLSAELKELRKQLYTYRYKSLELERQLRTHCHAFHRSIDARSGASSSSIPINAFDNAHPSLIKVFTNSLIMEIIASHLPVQDLLNCRVVCKSWASEMAQYVSRRKALVVAYEDCSEARALLKKKQDGKFVNISTLCILEIPVKSAIICEILKQFGETLSGLKLDDCQPEAEEMHELLSSIPSLEVLSFKQTGVRRALQEGSDAAEELSTLDGLTSYNTSLRVTSLKKLIWEEIKPVRHFERILEMFPCLEELELLCPLKPNLERMRGMSLDTLKNFTITCDSNFTEEHFRALANLNLKVKKLTLHDIKPDGRKKMRGLNLFLQSISQTVRELTFEGIGRISDEINPKDFVYMNTPFPIDFPLLELLEVDCSLITNMKMLDRTPRLQKFECKFHDWKGWWHLLNKNGVPMPHQNIKSVSLGAIDAGCLTKISTCFSAVTKLDIYEDRIDDAAFRAVCTHMKQLSHIRITTSTNERSRKLKLTDYGITGIPLEDCVQLNKTGWRKDIKALRKQPNICDLTALYSLELACSELSITDVSVIYGIGTLRRISTITLPKCELTDSSLEAFGNLPGLLVLELHKSCGVSSAGCNELRKKKKDLVFNLYAELSTRIFA